MSETKSSNPEMVMATSTNDLVKERGKTHGMFKDRARCTQRLKNVLLDERKYRQQRGQDPLTLMQVEAVEMILHKIARIIAGDANYQDHWDDIAGYARIANDDTI